MQKGNRRSPSTSVAGATFAQDDMIGWMVSLFWRLALTWVRLKACGSSGAEAPAYLREHFAGVETPACLRFCGVAARLKPCPVTKRKCRESGLSRFVLSQVLEARSFDCAQDRLWGTRHRWMIDQTELRVDLVIPPDSGLRWMHRDSGQVVIVVFSQFSDTSAVKACAADPGIETWGARFSLGDAERQPQIPFDFAQGRFSTSVAGATFAQDDMVG
jgi:hypothetical protein